MNNQPPPRHTHADASDAAPFVALAFGGLLVPSLLAPIPPLCDYANHLARLWLIAGGAAAPPLSSIYAVSWDSARTNVGMDLLAAGLGGVLPAETIGALCVLIGVVLPPLGAALIHRNVFGGWSPWQVLIAGLAWNATLMAGFINFQMGIGLATMAAAMEPWLARRPFATALGLRFVLGAIVMTAHLFGLVLYVGLVGALAFGGAAPQWRDLRALVRRVGVALVPAAAAAVPVLVLLALAPALPGAHAASYDNGTQWYWDVGHKLGVLLTPVSTYSVHLDVAFAAIPISIALWALVTQRLAAHAGLVLLGIAFVVLTLVAPHAAAGTWWIDNRFPVMAALVLMAGLAPHLGLEPRRMVLIAAALLTIVSLRTGLVAAAWKAGQADIAAVKRAVASVEPGAALLPLDHGGPGLDPIAYPLGRYYHLGQPQHWYYPALAVMWQRAFVPFLYAAAGKQPIRVLPPWDQIAHQEAGLSASLRLIEPDVESGLFPRLAATVRLRAPSQCRRRPRHRPRAAAGIASDRRRGLRAAISHRQEAVIG